MTSLPLSRAHRCAWLIVACAGSMSAWAQPATAIQSESPIASPRADASTDLGFKAILDAVWSRHPEAVSARSTLREAQALTQVGQSWIAGQPVAQIAQTAGLSEPRREQRATEWGLSVPIWQWGQRQQTQEQARSWETMAAAQSTLTRWRLATEIHDRAVRIWLAEAEVQHLSTQVQTLLDLDRDVQRRVRAGDLPPADALASEAEMLASQSQLHVAQQNRVTEQLGWRQMAGDTPPPAPGSWSASDWTPATTHPLLQWHQAQVELAQHRLSAIQTRWGAAPELAFSVKQEGGGASERMRSATVAVSIPIGKTAHRQTDIAAAMAELDRSEAEARQADMAVSHMRQESEAALESIRQQAKAEQQRAQLLQKRADWLQKAFNAGETDLPELLRAKSAAAQAQAGRIQKDIQVMAAQTRLKLAQGNLP